MKEDMRSALNRLADDADAARKAAYNVLRAVSDQRERPDFNIADVLEIRSTLLAAAAALDQAIAYNEGQLIKLTPDTRPHGVVGV